MEKSIAFWNLIVDDVNKNSLNPETMVQSQWINYFCEAFGYSLLFGEIVQQEKIHVGSAGNIIADILIKKDGKDLFVVELKRYYIQRNEKIVDQLKSYMKMLELEIGVLICDNIYLYCKHNDEYVCRKIPFERDNKDGEMFIELFSKENFDVSMVKDFILEAAKQESELREIEKALDEVCADAVGIIKNYLSEKFSFSPTALEKAFEDKNVKIHITSNKTPSDDLANNPLFLQLKSSTRIDNDKDDGEANSLSKTDAIMIINNQGYTKLTTRNTTLASKNRTQYIYWANPKFVLLSKDWYLILNDWINKKLYLFEIPAYSINPTPGVDLDPRSDKRSVVNLQIKYMDSSFTDSGSGYSFLKYKVAEFNY